jgi:glycosyl transferase family 1
MSASARRDAFAAAVQQLTKRPEGGGEQLAPVIYHQSNTLLNLTRQDAPFLVTHHGPFASEVCDRFGFAFAVEAFCGGPDKVRHLARAQALGVTHLQQSPRGIAIELSSVQDKVLRHNGVQKRKVFRTPPPIDLIPPCATPQLTNLPSFAPRSEGNSGRGLHIVSAAARADRFKNLSEVIAAANELTASGMPVWLSLFVGADDEERARTALRVQLSERLRTNALIAPRLSHAGLIEFFSRRESRAVFVCTSVYETLGITPLEAVLSGVPTLVPDRPGVVGVADYVEPEYRYPTTAGGLVENLADLAAAGNLARIGIRQREWAMRFGGSKRFFEVLDEALERLMRGGLAVPRARGRPEGQPLAGSATTA